MNTMTPNQIIAALLDIASAAFAVNHVVAGVEPEESDALRELDRALNKLDPLPQFEPNGHRTKTALARHYMQSFLPEGEMENAFRKPDGSDQ